MCWGNDSLSNSLASKGICDPSLQPPSQHSWWYQICGLYLWCTVREEHQPATSCHSIILGKNTTGCNLKKGCKKKQKPNEYYCPPITLQPNLHIGKMDNIFYYNNLYQYICFDVLKSDILHITGVGCHYQQSLVPGSWSRFIKNFLSC